MPGLSAQNGWQEALAYVSELLAVVFIGLAVAAFLRSGVAFRVGRGGVRNVEHAADAAFFAMFLFVVIGELLGIKFSVVREVLLLAIVGIASGGGLALLPHAWRTAARLASTHLTKKSGRSRNPKKDSSSECC